MSEKTVVEWIFIKSDFMIPNCHKQEFINLLVKAKEMEKKQLQEAYQQGGIDAQSNYKHH